MPTLDSLLKFNNRITRGLLKADNAINNIAGASAKVDKAFRQLTRTVETLSEEMSSVINLVSGSKATLKLEASAVITINNNASVILDEIYRKVQRLDGSTATPTLKVNDGASTVLDSVNSKLEKMKGSVLEIAGATSALSSGGLLFAGQSAFEMDTRAAAVTGLEVPYITSAVQSIYYDDKAGTSRAAVLESLLNIAQQTDLSGDELTEAARTSSRLNSLFPHADPREITRAQTTFYNAMGSEFGRTGDSLAYIYRNAGDQYRDLFDTFNKYATTFSKLKISPEQLASGLVAGQKAGGFNYDALAESVREWGIRSMNEKNDEVLKAYENLFGASKSQKLLNQLAEEEITGQQFLAEITLAMSTSNDLPEMKRIGSLLFGSKFKDNNRAILDFVEGLSTAADTAGELDSQFKTISSGPIIPIIESTRNLQGLLEDTGRSILEGVAPSFERLNQWMMSPEGQKSIADFTISVSKLAVVFGDALAKGIQWTIENIEWLIPVVGTIIGILSFFSTAIRALSFIRPIVTLLGNGFLWVLRWVMLLLPWVLRFLPIIGWVVTGLLAIWHAWEYWDQIKAWVAKNADWLLPLLGPIGDMINLFRKLPEIKETLAGLFGWLEEKLGGLLIKLIDVGVKIAEMGNGVGEIVSGNFKLGMPKWLGGGGIIQLKEKVDGSHAQGISNIPFDGYRAILHKGETVLPRPEAEVLRSMATRPQTEQAGKIINVTFSGAQHFHNEADEDRLVTKVVRAIDNLLGEEEDVGYKGGFAF
jgi:phage-related minor tail protein